MNTIGTATLCKREIWRFCKVWNQTVVAPVVTALLFLAILTLALGGGTRQIEGMRFDLFIAPGLIMMAIVQNAFANTSSSLIIAKIQGVIIDILMPPLSPAEITLSLVTGGVARGLMVGVAALFGVWLFVPLTVVHPVLAIAYVVLASVMMSLFGVLAGVSSNSFDQLSVITNYVVTPLAFLSGTFYSIRHLPGVWYSLAHADPFFYMIDGFRYAMTGYSDSTPGTGLLALVLANAVLWAAVQVMITKGWRLKS